MYVRCARTVDTLEVTGTVTVGGVQKEVTRELHGLDVLDALLPDVTNSTETQACAALDPVVSFDGRTIAFSVFRGSLYHPYLPLYSTSVGSGCRL